MKEFKVHYETSKDVFLKFHVLAEDQWDANEKVTAVMRDLKLLNMAGHRVVFVELGEGHMDRIDR